MVMWGLALPNHKVYQLNLGNFDFYERKLIILGKGNENDRHTF